jgi:hypothetical protein
LLSSSLVTLLRRSMRLAGAAALLALALAALGCARQDARLQQQKEKLESLGATTAAIGDAWLSGSVSGTYTRTALQQTLQLVEQERLAVAASPASLRDPRGAQLSQSAEHLSRIIAALDGDIGDADPASARRNLAAIPIKPAAHR